MATQPGTGNIIPPYGFELGDIWGGTFTVLRRRLGLYAALAAIPIAAIVVPLVVLGLAAIPIVRDFDWNTDVDGVPQNFPQALIPLVVVLFAAFLVSSLLQWKFTAMMALATKEIAEGGRPSVGSVWRGTRGVLPRLLLLALIGGLVFMVFALAAVVVALATSAGSDRTSSGDAAALTALVMLMGAVFLVFPLGLFLMVRWLFLMPVLAIEGLGGLASLGRSWRLTAGRFWRTLGFFVLAIGGVWGLQMLLSIPVNFLAPAILPAAGTDEKAAITAILLLTAVSMGLSLLSNLISMPFLAAYQTFMYIDAQMRADGFVVQRPAPQHFYGQQSPYPQPPAYGQPQPPNPYGQQPPNPNG